MYWPSHKRDAGLVVEAHQAEDLRVAEAEVRQAVERDPTQAEQHVAGVDRLGDAVERPQRRAVAALAIAVLDVVVDEAEVVTQLDGGGAGQSGGVIAGDRGVGEQAKERSHPLAGRRAIAVEPKVVADHLVGAGGRGVVIADEPEDLRLGVRDQGVEIELARHGSHRGASVAAFRQTCEPPVACSRNGSGAVASLVATRRDWRRPGGRDRTGAYTAIRMNRPIRSLVGASEFSPAAGGVLRVLPCDRADPAPLHDRGHRPLPVRLR